MKVSMRVVCAMVLLAAVVVSGAGPIEARQPAQEKVVPPPVPLKVTVTVSRYEGEKRTASLPFVLWVNTGGSGSIRMSSDVPSSTTVTTVKDGTTTTGFSYRTLGTNIDCSASVVADGLYRLQLSVQDSQVFRMNTAQAPSDASRTIFQDFRAQFQPLLRDGQTVQFAVATDKTSGEVIKLDVALNLVK